MGHWGTLTVRAQSATIAVIGGSGLLLLGGVDRFPLDASVVALFDVETNDDLL